MDLQVNILGIDILTEDNSYGVWILNLSGKKGHRSLFQVYYSMGEWFMDFCFIHIIKGGW